VRYGDFTSNERQKGATRWEKEPLTFILQTKTLHGTSSFIFQLCVGKFIVNHNSPGNNEYNVVLNRPVNFIPSSASLKINIIKVLQALKYSLRFADSRYYNLL